MVAAGSMVAAVEGLQMRMVGNTMMSQKLTQQLAQTIRSDPVSVMHVAFMLDEPRASVTFKLILTLTPQDCLRACQEQIEALLETSLRQAQQQHSVTMENKNINEGQDLSTTPTDVRDVNLWGEADWNAECNRDPWYTQISNTLDQSGNCSLRCRINWQHVHNRNSANTDGMAEKVCYMCCRHLQAKGYLSSRLAHIKREPVLDATTQGVVSETLTLQSEVSSLRPWK